MNCTVPADQLPPGVERVRVRTGMDIAYETFGRPGDPAILLVMGFSTQMLAWPDAMCEALAAAGHYVIRYDNRDIGLSTHLDLPAPSRVDLAVPARAPYSIADMAADGIGLLEALDITAAHVVGASMGGFISQTMAINHPQQVLSLTLVMTSSGARRVGQATPKVLLSMARRADATNRSEAQDAAVTTYEMIGSKGQLDEATVRELAGRAYDRCYDPVGVLRQLQAIIHQPNRTADLRKIRVPTRVIHGLADPLVAASGGMAIAQAIPGATFIGHQGMGHDLPRTMWPVLVEDILDLIDRDRPAGPARSEPASALDGLAQ